MQFPDDSIFLQHAQGDSGFENVYIYGKLNYDFKNDDIVVKSINVTSPSVFSGDVAFSGDITLDEITCRNANVTGVATVTSALYVDGKLHDGDGDFGSSGQLLSSDGSKLNWINANTTSVANSINVGTNLNSTDADQFVTFVENSSGNNPIRVDTDLKYNPSTNRLTAGSFAGDGSALTGVDSFVSGMIIMWNSTVASIPTGFVLCDGNNNTPDLRGRFVVGHHPSNGDYDVDDTGGAESVTLNLNQIPSHTHSYVGHTYPGSGPEQNQSGGPEDRTSFNVNKTTGSAGGGQAHENRPPYYALCYIMKT